MNPLRLDAFSRLWRLKSSSVWIVVCMNIVVCILYELLYELLPGRADDVRMVHISQKSLPVSSDAAMVLKIPWTDLWMHSSTRFYIDHGSLKCYLYEKLCQRSRKRGHGEDLKDRYMHMVYMNPLFERNIFLSIHFFATKEGEHHSSQRYKQTIKPHVKWSRILQIKDKIKFINVSMWNTLKNVIWTNDKWSRLFR
jgi:hypothetical protein